LFIRQPEFLTTELISRIQKLLAGGHANWAVSISLVFEPQLETLLGGVEVRAEVVSLEVV
jgi:hypothetical protein